MDLQPPPGAREADLEGLGTKPRIPSFASLTLDLVIVVPYLKKERWKLEIISSNPVLSWRKRARHRRQRTYTRSHTGVGPQARGWKQPTANPIHSKMVLTSF